MPERKLKHRIKYIEEHDDYLFPESFARAIATNTCPLCHGKLRAIDPLKNADGAKLECAKCDAAIVEEL